MRTAVGETISLQVTDNNNSKDDKDEDDVDEENHRLPVCLSLI